MDPVKLIIVLGLVGFLLIAAEVFVPGMVLGSLGGLCLFAVIILGYINFGILAGSLIFAGLAVFSLAGFVIWMAAFPRTSMGRKIMLENSLEQGEGSVARPPELLGRNGVALTPLRPSGTAKIGGRKIDVVAESSFIDAGAAVTVVLSQGMRVVVRKSEVENPRQGLGIGEEGSQA